ncbi:MAG: hypothetical protein ACXQTI_04725, partial [Candidatus Nezhaarchaeales archaeon]
MVRAVCGKVCGECVFDGLCCGCSGGCLAYYCLRLTVDRDCSSCLLYGCLNKPIDEGCVDGLLREAFSLSGCFDGAFDVPRFIPLIPIGGDLRAIRILRGSWIDLVAVGFGDVLGIGWFWRRCIEIGGVNELLG